MQELNEFVKPNLDWFNKVMRASIADLPEGVSTKTNMEVRHMMNMLFTPKDETTKEVKEANENQRQQSVAVAFAYLGDPGSASGGVGSGEASRSGGSDSAEARPGHQGP